ncbi:MAG TPA: outer membrane beta-barrel protein, partial [Micropepsaceae bacterium]|nr:outer membrane beta-barrel protein [Micropepsaceae bacterium]
MKLKTFAFAGASLIAFASPAAAADGWYLGLGAGWSKLRDVAYSVNGGPQGKDTYKDTARFDLAAGYKWPMGIRLEIETGYGNYALKNSFTPPPVAAIAGADGHVDIGTVMANVAYDFPIAPQFAFTVGAGAGAGRVLAHYSDPVETERKG